MLSFELDKETLREFGRRFRRYTKKHVGIAFDDVRREWQNELIHQQENNTNGWHALSPAYAKRKESDYAAGRNGVIYNSLLKRTGRMMSGYIGGIYIDRVNSTISIPFPSGATNLRAKVHQGVVDAPRGLHPRPFDTERFEEIAIERFERVYDRYNDEE